MNSRYLYFMMLIIPSISLQARSFKAIYQRDIPLTIKCPGNYYLAENIRQCDPNAAAITVQDVDGVFIEGNNRKIDLKNSGSQGISISNASNVTVSNLLIENSNLTLIDDLDILPCTPLTSIPNFRVAAVRLDAVRLIFLNNLKINNVLYGIVGTNIIDRVSIDGCSIADFGTIPTPNEPVGAGIFLTGTSNTARMMNVSVANSTFSSETGKYGCWLMFADGGVVQNCFGASAHQNIPFVSIGAFTFVDSTGLSVNGCEGRFGNHHVFALRCLSCDISGFKSFDTNHNGIEITFCQHCTLRNCTTHRTATIDDFTGSGLVFNFDTYCSMQNCLASNYIQGTTANTGCGIVVNAGLNCEVIDCVTYGNNYGIKNINSAGSPCGFITGGNNRYYSNFSNDNLIQNYSDVPYVVDAETGITPINTTLVPFVNVQAPNLPTT